MEDEEQVTSPQMQRIHEVYRSLADSEAYKHYADYRSVFDVRFEELSADVSNQLQPELSAEAETILRVNQAEHTWAPFSTQRNTAGLFLVAVYFVAFIGSSFELGIAPTISQSPLFAWPILISAALAGVGFSLALRSESLLIRQNRQSAAVALEVAREDLERRRLTLVKEVFTRVINDTLGPEHKLPFPVVAPRLVELSTSKIVPSSSASFLVNFVSGHASSAVGIAGSRGSGKSTLMRSLLYEPTLNPVPVLMTAPVKYDRLDFARRLYLNVAQSVFPGHREYVQQRDYSRARRVVSVRLFISMLAIGIGLSLVTFDLVNDGQDLPNIGPTVTLGILLVGYGFILATISGVDATTSRRKYLLSRGTKSEDLARHAVEQLSYSRETNSKSKNVAKLFQAGLTVEDEDSITLKDRDLSHADVVNDLKELLSAIARDSSPRPVIVAIDELDKMSSADHLVETINDLKDLFHVEGVHFVVSVSTDALSSFEQRGLPSRDAFDSSFDTIIAVNSLSLAESLLVLSSRAEGFPPIVGAFCHAWAGGIPRDLLRVARRCVEIQRDMNRALPVSAFVATVVREDLVAIVDGRLRSSHPSTTSSGTGLGLTPEDRVVLSSLRRRAYSLGGPADVGESGMRAAEESHPVTSDPVLKTIESLISLAEALVRYFSDAAETQKDRWSAPDEDLFAAVATAMALRGDVEEIRSEAFEDAFALLPRG